MDLQHQQLQQLTDWLDVTEARIKRMGAQPLGPDLEDVKHQVEEHKVRSCSGLTNPGLCVVVRLHPFNFTCSFRFHTTYAVCSNKGCVTLSFA